MKNPSVIAPSLEAISLEREVARLEALSQYQILDTELEPAFDDLAKLAAQICGTPIALICFIDRDRQWVKAHVGWAAAPIPRSLSFCNLTIQQTEPLVVTDALADPRFATLPWAIAEPLVRFYAGVALQTAEGYPIGTICVLDAKPRELTPDQLEALQMLGRQVTAQLELRRQTIQRSPRTSLEPPNQGPLARTGEQIAAEVQEKFGFLPPFFGPAQTNPQVFESLWQQTWLVYANNPWSAIFKEKLSAYLSRYCAIPYCMICHSCALQPLGVEATAISKLLVTPPPTELEVDQHLQTLVNSRNQLANVLTLTPELEESLLRCAIFMFLQPTQAEYCRRELRELLGLENYQHLAAFLAYVKTCHMWMEAHPEVTYTEDRRVLNHFGQLIAAAPELADFLEHYRERVQQESQVWTAQQLAIAERKRYERAIQQAAIENLRLARAVNAVADGVLITDPTQPNNPIIYANPAFSRITGYDAEEVIGKNCRFLQGADTDPTVVAQLKQAIAEQREIQTTVLNYRKDGQPFWNELKISPIFADNGSLLYFVGIQTDITQRKQAAQQLQEQATLLEVATDAIFVQDLDSKILVWNKGAENLYGWSATQAIGRSANELLSPELSSQLDLAWQQIIEVGNWQGELHQLTQTDREVAVASRWTLVRDEQNRPKSILVVNTDITEKKQLEAQVLRNQRLESIGTLAGGIAHDLNNVLAPILMSTQLLTLTAPSERNQRLLNTIEVNAKRGADLVKQVLSFARGIEGERTLLQVRHLILETAKITQETFPKTIEIYADVPQALWTIAGDATQLYQVLMNLCVNARDAMPQGGTLNLVAENALLSPSNMPIHPDAQAGAHIMITVTDTGEGIPANILDRIFEPFFTTKDIGKGTGLGLSTVMTIVKSHGGFITAESQVNRGTTFTVYLPATTHQAKAIAAEDPALPTGQDELILVVDDESAIREITKTSLEAFAYQVVTAKDGIEAIAVYAQQPQSIKAVVIDMMMPVMDGPTTIRTLQKMNPDLKVVAVSGLMESEQLGAVVNQVDAFLTKPFTAKQLLQTLDQVLHS